MILWQSSSLSLCSSSSLNRAPFAGVVVVIVEVGVVYFALVVETTASTDETAVPVGTVEAVGSAIGITVVAGVEAGTEEVGAGVFRLIVEGAGGQGGTTALSSLWRNFNLFPFEFGAADVDADEVKARLIPVDGAAMIEATIGVGAEATWLASTHLFDVAKEEGHVNVAGAGRKQ